MKKDNSIIGIFILVFAFIICPGIAGRIESTYKLTGIVVEKNNDMIVFESEDGNLWETAAKNISIGDKVSAIMDDKHTTSIYDDEIIKISVDK